MELKVNKELLEANAKNIYDWTSIMDNMETYLSDLRTENHRIATKFMQVAKHHSVNDFNLIEFGEYIKNKLGETGIQHLCARVISGVGFAVACIGETVVDILSAI